MLTREVVGRLPKAELHVHLDGSLRPETMIALAREAGISLPSTDPDALRRFMRVDDASNLEDYLRRFDVTIPLLQTPDPLAKLTALYAERDPLYQDIADVIVDTGHQSVSNLVHRLEQKLAQLKNAPAAVVPESCTGAKTCAP